MPGNPILTLAMTTALAVVFASTAAANPAIADASKDRTEMPATAPPGSPSQLDLAIAGAWRDPANVARDRFRHPKQTLEFFGVNPAQTVIEITPGGGWYAEILAALLNANGHYIAAEAKPKTPDGEAAQDNSALAKKFAADSIDYGNAKTVEFDPSAPSLGPAASADVVLTFRNVHNWVMGGNQAAMFKAFFDVLKPGGVLGVTDHRAPAGAATDGKHGYVTEKQVIDYATAAGFALAEKSEINANPKDTKDYEKGVWTLPPALAMRDVDKDKYQAIGESDRMTLKFVKPQAK